MTVTGETDRSNQDASQQDGASTIDQAAAQGREPEPAPKPSQAEGERETTEKDPEETSA